MDRRQSVEDNDYDTVASEEDYAFLNDGGGTQKNSIQRNTSVVSSCFIISCRTHSCLGNNQSTLLYAGC